MNLLILVPSLVRAGAETQSVDLANGLSERGHLVHLCVLSPQLDQLARVSSRVRFHQLVRKSRLDRKLITSLAEIIDGERIDVVLGVMQFATLYGWLAARRSSREPAVVAAIHTTVNRGFKEEWQDRLVYRRLLSRLPSIIFVCRSQRDHWIRKFPELAAGARVVYNGIDPTLFRRTEFEQQAADLRRQLGIPRDGLVFSCIAAFRPEKGQHLLLEALGRVKPATAYVVFAGDGECRAEVERYAAVLGLTNRVRFVGNVQDVRPLIVASNATVLASTAVETFSMAMLESMSLGVPVIAPRIGGLGEAIEDPANGSLFPTGDVKALSDCLSAAIHDHDALRVKGQSAHLKVSRQFTRNAMLSETETVLEGAWATSAGRRDRQ